MAASAAGAIFGAPRGDAIVHKSLQMNSANIAFNYWRKVQLSAGNNAIEMTPCATGMLNLDGDNSLDFFTSAHLSSFLTELMH